MPCSSTLSQVLVEHGAHRGDLAAPQAVNNVMSERLSHLQGEEKKGSVKKKRKPTHPATQILCKYTVTGALSLSVDAI